jgi:hypothetical protein
MNGTNIRRGGTTGKGLAGGNAKTVPFYCNKTPEKPGTFAKGAHFRGIARIGITTFSEMVSETLTTAQTTLNTALMIPTIVLYDWVGRRFQSLLSWVSPHAAVSVSLTAPAPF